jgi:AraC-like DNA-binding protein
MSILDLDDSTAAAREPAFFSAQVAQSRRFWFDPDPPPRTPLAVVCGGREHCAADYRLSRPTFAYHAVEVVVGGRGTLRLGGLGHPLRPGSAYVYGPGVAHAIETDPRRPLVKYFVSFAGRRAPGLLRDCGLPLGTVTHAMAVDAVAGLMDELIATAARHSPRGPAICAVVLEHLLLRLAETSVPAAAAESRSFLTFQRCRRFIADHHRDVPDLAAVATACGVDASYLCRLFQRYHKQSPYRYLTHLKMAAAADLLHRPGRLVKEVAGELGFADPFLFSRAFKNVYGVSPKHFQSRWPASAGAGGRGAGPGS